MSFVATLFQPFLAFLGTYKWYILIFILLYLALTIVFRHSRELITVVFGTLIIIFVITHLGDVYGSHTAMEKAISATKGTSAHFILLSKITNIEQCEREIYFAILNCMSKEGKDNG